MSQNDENFNRRGVTKHSCGCTLMFHFDIVPIISTVLTVQNPDWKSIKTSCFFVFCICLHPIFMWLYNQRYFLSRSPLITNVNLLLYRGGILGRNWDQILDFCYMPFRVTSTSWFTPPPPWFSWTCPNLLCLHCLFLYLWKKHCSARKT